MHGPCGPRAGFNGIDAMSRIISEFSGLSVTDGRINLAPASLRLRQAGKGRALLARLVVTAIRKSGKRENVKSNPCVCAWMPARLYPHLDNWRKFRTLRSMSSIPAEFQGVTALTKANVYFEGRVISHCLVFPDGSKKTLGVIYPGKFHFNTDKAERMQIVSGQCIVRIVGQTSATTYPAGELFDVPAKCGFDIEVKEGLCQYICSFLS